VAPSAEPLLLKLATLSCPANGGNRLVMKMLETSNKKGLHPTARELDATAQLVVPVMILIKVAQGYACLVPWARFHQLLQSLTKAGVNA
jgi:hypothetical protein